MALALLAVATGSASTDPDLPDAVAVPPEKSGQEDEKPPHEETQDEKSETGAQPAMPSAERQCREALDAMSVVYRDGEPQEEASGCEMAHPVIVEELPGNVAVEPEVVLNCQTAKATARLMEEVVAPAAEEFFEAQVESIQQMSGYVCRPRSGGGNLSEHAFGNAIDIGSVTLDDGTQIMVRPYGRVHDAHDGFVWRVREGACGIFTTVLGPATDEAHADHLHFDLAERRPGSTYCR